METIKNRTALFDSNTIGAHIRRTDHKKAIEGSSDKAFEAAMRTEIAANPARNFFLATDFPETKDKFGFLFGDRIISFKETADRTELAGVKNAVADLYSLAATTKILGSASSSFFLNCGADWWDNSCFCANRGH